MRKAIAENRFIIAMIVTGFTAMLSQILLLREIVAIFLGNELSIGIMLGTWLFGTAIGSSLLIRLLPGKADHMLIFICIQIGLAFILPATVLLSRLSPEIWHMIRGEIPALSTVLLLPFSIILPFCMLIGLLYTLGCKILHHLTAEKITAIARVYLFEAAGAGFASLMISIALFRWLGTFQIILFISVIHIVTALFLLHSCFYNLRRVKLFLIFLIPLFFFLLPKVDRFSIRKFWKNLTVVHTESTIYGTIAVIRLGESVSFYENGNLLFTYPDRLYAEESAHFALLQHLRPESVLLIGGGTGGSTKEILKHPSVDRLDYIELDPKIIELSRRFLPDTAVQIFNDSRLHVVHQDARNFISKTSKDYDVIIVNLPDPHSTIINRFYSTEFYLEAKKKLRPGGIITFSVNSSENVIGHDLAVFLGCLYHTLEKSFEDILVIPGDVNHFIGSLTAGELIRNPDQLIHRLKERNLNTVYFNEHYIPFRMSAERVSYLQEIIAAQSADVINSDFKPIGHFYHLLIWTTHFNQHTRELFFIIARIMFMSVLVLSLLLLLPFIVYRYVVLPKEADVRYGIMTSILIVGFSGMALEVVIIHGFQALCGYIYYQLAIILSSFMIGMALGSYAAIQLLRKNKNIFVIFKITQLVMALFPLLLAGVLLMSHRYFHNTFFIQLQFFILTILTGCIAGYQFPLANHLYGRLDNRVERVAGQIYAVDLLGACLGALATSALFIPLMGIVKTCLAIAFLNSSVFFGLALLRSHRVGIRSSNSSK